MEGILNENDSSRIAYIIQANVLPGLEQNVFEAGRPHVIHHAKICKDGNAWCCSLGEDPMNGIFAYGDTPAKACDAFDDIWWKGNPAPADSGKD